MGKRKSDALGPQRNPRGRPTPRLSSPAEKEKVPTSTPVHSPSNKSRQPSPQERDSKTSLDTNLSSKPFVQLSKDATVLTVQDGKFSRPQDVIEWIGNRPNGEQYKHLFAVYKYLDTRQKRSEDFGKAIHDYVAKNQDLLNISQEEYLQNWAQNKQVAKPEQTKKQKTTLKKKIASNWGIKKFQDLCDYLRPDGNMSKSLLAAIRSLSIREDFEHSMELVARVVYDRMMAPATRRASGPMPTIKDFEDAITIRESRLQEGKKGTAVVNKLAPDELKHIGCTLNAIGLPVSALDPGVADNDEDDDRHQDAGSEAGSDSDSDVGGLDEARYYSDEEEPVKLWE